MPETFFEHGSSGGASDPVVPGDFVCAAPWLRAPIPFGIRRYIASRRSVPGQRSPLYQVTHL